MLNRIRLIAFSRPQWARPSIGWIVALFTSQWAQTDQITSADKSIH